MTTWYVPAYQAENGNIITIGTPTITVEGAAAEVDILRSQGHDAFVAFRIEPDWRPMGDI